MAIRQAQPAVLFSIVTCLPSSDTVAYRRPRPPSVASPAPITTAPAMSELRLPTLSTNIKASQVERKFTTPWTPWAMKGDKTYRSVVKTYIWYPDYCSYIH